MKGNWNLGYDTFEETPYITIKCPYCNISNAFTAQDGYLEMLIIGKRLEVICASCKKGFSVKINVDIEKQ